MCRIGILAFTEANRVRQVNSSGKVRGWVIFVDIRSSGLDRVIVKLFFLRGIGSPEAEQGKVNGAFME